MSTSKSLLEEAEKNVIMQAKFFHDLLTFMDSFLYATINKMHGNEKNANEFSDGITRAKAAVYAEMQFAMARCFALAGVGGKEANRLSKEYANELFGGKYSNIQWLEKWYNIPGTWSQADSEKLQNELNNAIQKNQTK